MTKYSKKSKKRRREREEELISSDEPMSAKEDTVSGKEEAGMENPKIPSKSSFEGASPKSKSSKTGQSSKSNYIEVLDDTKASVRLVRSRLLKKKPRRSDRDSG